VSNPSVQSAIVDRLGSWPAIVAGGYKVSDRFPKDTDDPGDPEGTPDLFDHGTPVASIYVVDGGPKPHPDSRLARLGVEVWYVPVWFYAPSDEGGKVRAMRAAVYDALAANPDGTGPNWRFQTEWGTPATVYWEEDGAQPLIDPAFPDTILDVSRYRVEARRRTEVF
jgi:hypothetical protein